MVIKFREIPVGTVPFLINSTQILKIPRVNAIRRIMLRIFVESVEEGEGKSQKNWKL